MVDVGNDGKVTCELDGHISMIGLIEARCLGASALQKVCERKRIQDRVILQEKVSIFSDLPLYL